MQESKSGEAVIYKSRDDSEKTFRADKSYLGAHCERVYSEESYDTKIFIGFVATIIRNRIYTLLKDEMDRMDILLAVEASVHHKFNLIEL